MEEILLASDGFYYQGTPSQSSYSATTKATEGYASAEIAEEYAFRNIESALVISQIVVITLAVICIIKGILNSKNNKKIAAEESDLSSESLEQNVHQKATVPYFALSMILFIAYGVMNIVKGFVENLF